ncbi:MAG TPA: sigma-70 family RNA polymerase sigma factor [Pyrinomonadaceae bacterium]|nr:sigma-70 family RNA polymerase sigma factor [Pyrinomonadaceae bacterium]
MSDKRKGETQAGNSHMALRVVVSVGSKVLREAPMFEAEATADVFLMTQPLSAPAEQSVEAKLIEAVLNGEQDCFARLYEMYAPMVHGILLARVPRAEVDDLVQDIFLHALRKLHTLRNAGAFGGWLAMITRNRAMDFYRSSRETVEVTEKTAVAKSPNRIAMEILDLIRSLPEAYRETLVLRFVEGMTGPEIASRTGLTAASVRVNLHRGVKMLREKMGVMSEPPTVAGG